MPYLEVLKMAADEKNQGKRASLSSPEVTTLKFRLTQQLHCFRDGVKSGASGGNIRNRYSYSICGACDRIGITI